MEEPGQRLEERSALWAGLYSSGFLIYKAPGTGEKYTHFRFFENFFAANLIDLRKMRMPGQALGGLPMLAGRFDTAIKH
jgi:hypothetical protein